MSELKQVELVFENCESLIVPGKHVRYLNFDGITKYGRGANLWWNGIGRWYDETERVACAEIGIDKSFLESSFKGLGGEESCSKLERLKKWEDITWVHITNKEYFYIWYYNPIKFIKALVRKLKGTRICLKSYSRSCFKIRKGSSKYKYCMPWYVGKYVEGQEDFFLDEEGKKHFTDYENKWQKTSEDSDDEKVIVNILIEEPKNEGIQS